MAFPELHNSLDGFGFNASALSGESSSPHYLVSKENPVKRLAFWGHCYRWFDWCQDDLTGDLDVDFVSCLTFQQHASVS